MMMRNFLRIVPLLFGLTAVSRADLILHYTGGQLTPCVDGVGCQVSIDLLLLNPLPANFSAQYIDPVFHQFVAPSVRASDGYHVLNDAWGTNATGFIDTDAQGNISSWSMLFEGGIGLEGFETIEASGGPGGQGGSLVEIIGPNGRHIVTAGPGSTWQVTPEPGSWALAGMAFIACVGIERLRRRRRVL
jgi:hypothetical protein